MNLVTDNPETNVSNALNMFYVKDQQTFVRGYGENGQDIDLIDFVKRIAKRQRIPMQKKDAHEVAEYLTDVLFDCEPESKEGLLGLFFTAAWAFAEIRERLKEYEASGLEPNQVSKMMIPLDKVEETIEKSESEDTE